MAILLDVVDQCVRRVSWNTLANSKLEIKLKRKKQKKTVFVLKKGPIAFRIDVRARSSQK